MAKQQSAILTINAGSSSIKFSMYGTGRKPILLATGKVQKIGSPECCFEFAPAGKSPVLEKIATKDMSGAADYLISWVSKNIGFINIKAVGHRIVHGMNHVQPQVINNKLLAELKTIIKYDPDHMPTAIMLIKSIKKAQPALAQIACFDTSFHTSLPRVAQMLPLPRRFEKEGIKRFGFHGISYQYLLEKLLITGGKKLAHGKLILAHLGSGASMAAVKDGKCIDTSMGFTPAGGFMMSTRTGDLDPGVISFLLEQDRLSAHQLDAIFNQQSGLLGVSELSADMGELLKVEKKNKKAAEAIALFCYQAKKTLCAYAGILGGADTIVFTGGIGEHSHLIRSRICEGLKFLGIRLNEKKNSENELKISAADSKVAVYVIAANEEYIIAKSVIKLLQHPGK